MATFAQKNLLGVSVVGSLQKKEQAPKRRIDLFVKIPPKTNIDTQNDGLEIMTPFKYGHF